MALKKGQVAKVLLRLEGGIVVVASTGPTGDKRPSWPIDLGRGASLLYVLGGAEAGNYVLTVTSHERERPARLTVSSGDAEPADQAALRLREVEDDLAKAELTRRHWPGALPNLDAAATFDDAFRLARALGNTPLERLALTQKARLMIFAQGKFDGARTLLEQATALPPADDMAIEALAWKTLSTARYDLGDFRGAIQASAAALDLYRKTGDRYWQGIVLGNLSSVYSELGQPRDALAAAKDALDDAKLEQDPAGVVYCLSQLASLYGLQGDVQAAFRTYSEGLAWVSEISYAPLIEAEIQKDLGVFSIQVSDWDQAYRALTRAIEIEGSREDPVSLESRGGLADVLQHRGKLDLAIDEDSKAIAIAHSLKLKHDEAELLLNRTAMHLARGRASDASADIAAANVLASELKALPLQIEVQQAAGNAQLAIDPKEAEAHFRAALQLAEQIGEREQQSAALAGIAQANQKQGRTAEALAAIEQALEILEASGSSLSSLELQATYLSMHRGWYELAVDLCMQLDHARPGAGYAQRAFAYTERAHAQSLMDALNRSAYNPAEQVPEKVREAIARNRQQIQNEESELTDSPEASRATIAVRLKALYREREGLESQMQSADERLHPFLGGGPIDIASVQKDLLGDRSVLLSYWIGAKASYRWTIAAHSFSVETLPPRSTIERIVVPLERSLAERRPEIQPGDDIAAYAARQQSFETEIQRNQLRAGSLLLPHLPADTHTVLVVADGCLLSLPFPALRIASNRVPTYAIERFAFLREPSASVAVYLRENPPRTGGDRIAVFADPIFSAGDFRLNSLARASQSGANSGPFSSSPRLTGSMREARQILALSPRITVELHAGFDANPAQVRDLDPENLAILHFATHTVAIPNHPEVSGIALSMFDRAGQKQDGVLWARDIYSLRLSLALVMLSGCKTDSAESFSGEDVDSLAHAFFFSGVRSVGASLWSVDDAIASRMMGDFYRKLGSGMSVADSMRAAQLDLLRTRTSSSPSLWAPFILEGWPEIASLNSVHKVRDSALSIAPESR